MGLLPEIRPLPDEPWWLTDAERGLSDEDAVALAMRWLDAEDDPTRAAVSNKLDQVFDRTPNGLTPRWLSRPRAVLLTWETGGQAADVHIGRDIMDRIGVAFTGGGMSPPGRGALCTARRGVGLRIRVGCRRPRRRPIFHPHRLRVGNVADSTGHQHQQRVCPQRADDCDGGGVCRLLLSKAGLSSGLGSSHKVQVGPEHGLEFSAPIPRVRDTD